MVEKYEVTLKSSTPKLVFCDGGDECLVNILKSRCDVFELPKLASVGMFKVVKINQQETDITAIVLEMIFM